LEKKESDLIMDYPLQLIQSQGVLNRPIACGVYHDRVNPCYRYKVVREEQPDDSCVSEIIFQRGNPKDSDSQLGLLDVDLLEIVRDRLIRFQSGDLKSREGAIALTHVEEALLWLNKRTTDRIQRGVFQTNNK